MISGPRRFVERAVTGSTNDDAKELAARGESHGTVVVADAQTKGRGRGDHAWHSPPGENLYWSMILRPRLDARVVPALALAIGFAVADVVDGALGAARARIKWPNDVLVDQKKIAGVLVEAQLRGREVASIVAGVGLNVATMRFPQELAERATSLALLGASELDRAALAIALADRVDAATASYALEGLAPILDSLNARDALVGRRVRVGDVEGVASGIDPEGRLRVRAAAGSIDLVGHGQVDLLDAYLEPSR